MADRADVVVIGGGVIGVSTAFHLAKAGAGNVTLLECRFLGAGASGKSGAVVRMHYSNPLSKTSGISENFMVPCARTVPLPIEGGTRTVPERILRVNIVGWVEVMRLHRDGRSVARQLCAVVLESFAGPCLPCQVIHHQDGDRRNCALANL